MARVKIKFPDENPLHTALIPVRIGDINYGGHIGNDAVLSVIHEARMQLLSQWGFDELHAGGNSLIMGDVMIAYRGEAFYGDILSISMYAEEITSTKALCDHRTSAKLKAGCRSARFDASRDGCECFA